MPPRTPGLPEGTDHIIDTNIDLGDTGGGGGGGGGTSGTGGGATGGGAGGTTAGSGKSGSSSGTGGDGSAFQFDQDGSGGGSGRSGVSKAAESVMGQVKDQISTLTSQAGDRARGLADDGKSRATGLLQSIADVVADAAGSVEERLGGQYAGVGNRASDSIRSLASSLDERSVDDLIEDARSFVKRSPAVAIGIAAIVGFAVARVVRSSVSELTSGGDRDGGVGGSNATGGSGGGSGGGGNSGSTGTGGNAAMGSAGTSGAGAA